MLARKNSEGTVHVLSSDDTRQNGKGHAKDRQVLLVDDHALFRQILAIICEQHTGLNENVQAGSLAEARRVLRGRNGSEFDLAVVDLDLPDEGVLELIGELRRAGTPVLAFSASQHDKRLAALSGQGEMLSTAASYDDILGAISRLVKA